METTEITITTGTITTTTTTIGEDSTTTTEVRILNIVKFLGFKT